MPAFLERLNKYENLTDEEKRIFRAMLTDFMPTGKDYKFHCEPLILELPENFIRIWEKYPENPAPQDSPIDSFNRWRSKIVDELSLARIGYLPPVERLIRYGSIDGKKFSNLLNDLQVLSTKEFQGIDFEIPEIFIDIWRNHPENFEPNSNLMETFVEYCKRVNDEIRNPDKYINPENIPVLHELTDEEKEALKVAPPQMMYPSHSFLNTAAFDYSQIQELQEKFAQSLEPATIADYVTVRATNDFPIKGYYTPVTTDTRISAKKSFLGPEIVSFNYRDTKHFALNGLTNFAQGQGEWTDSDFYIIEPLQDNINNPNLISLHPRRHSL